MIQTANTLYEKHLSIEQKYISQMHWELGKLYGYPECCIKQFIEEITTTIQPAIYRQAKHKRILPAVGYVPCDNCMKKIYDTR